MNRRIRNFVVISCALAACAGASATARAAAAPAATQPAIDALIEQLGDRSALRRDEAVAALTRIGRPARAALLEAAARSPLAQRRQLARAVLRKLPLWSEADPKTLRDALARYQQTATEGRADHALRLARSGSGSNADEAAVADDALARILVEEPSDDVLWTIVSRMRQSDRERLTGRLLAGNVEPTSPPLLFLFGAGTATTEEALPRAVAWFEQCLRETTLAPPEAYAAFMRMGTVLAAEARRTGDAEREIAAWREVALLLPAQAGPTDEQSLPPAVDAYLTTRLRLHEAKNLEADLQAMNIAPQHPTVQLVAAILERPTTQPTTAPMAINAVPGRIWETLDTMMPEQQIDAVELLQRAGELGLVDAITQRLTTMTKNMRDETRGPLLRLQVCMLRYNLARATRDRDAAAEMLKTVLREMPDGIQITRRDAEGNVTILPASDLFAEMHIANLRRAMLTDDKAEIERALEELARVSIRDSSLALDAIYLFEQHGRIVEADEVYAEHLADALQELDADPSNPSEMNSVAWFCARSGRNLEFAYRLASAAVRRSPRNSALLDTFAETAFRTGHAQEAVNAELRALNSMPGDPFMNRQLERFRAGLRPGDAEMALPSEGWVE